jgi:hypothetical protein
MPDCINVMAGDTSTAQKQPILNEQSEAPTPLDLFNLVQDWDTENPSPSQRLTGRLLSELGDTLPTGKERESDSNWTEDDHMVNARNFRGAASSIYDVASEGLQQSRRGAKQGAKRGALWLPRMPLPSTDMDRLRRWTPANMRRINRDVSQYYAVPMYASKRDVALSLDPVHRGVITETRAHELYRSYAPLACFRSVADPSKVLDPDPSFLWYP